MMGNSNQLVGDNKFTLFPILGVERSFPFSGKVATGKGFSNFGKAATGKGFSNFGKGKDPFLSQERSSLQLGKVSVILGKERILSFPRMVKRKASKGERKGFRPSLTL